MLCEVGNVKGLLAEALRQSKAIQPTEGLAMIKILYITGLVICGIAAGLLLMGKIESGVAALVGIVGIGLMGSSGLTVFLLPLCRRERRP